MREIVQAHPASFTSILCAKSALDARAFFHFKNNRITRNKREKKKLKTQKRPDNMTCDNAKYCAAVHGTVCEGLHTHNAHKFLYNFFFRHCHVQTLFPIHRLLAVFDVALALALARSYVGSVCVFWFLFRDRFSLTYHKFVCVVRCVDVAAWHMALTRTHTMKR